MNITLLGKSDFADVIKGLGVERLSWIIWVGPKCNPRNPGGRQKECGYRRGGGSVTLNAKMRVMHPMTAG